MIPIPAPDLARLAELIASWEPQLLPPEHEVVVELQQLKALLATAQDHARMAQELKEAKANESTEVIYDLNDLREEWKAVCAVLGSKHSDDLRCDVVKLVDERDALQADLTALRARTVTLPQRWDRDIFDSHLFKDIDGHWMFAADVLAMLTNAGIGVTP